MELLRWASRPTLRDPVLVCAFAGWNDAGDAATGAGRFLIENWPAESIASIDPEDFYDFTSQRPSVRLLDDLTRIVVWPPNEFVALTPPLGSRDVIVLMGVEPHLRWRTFCEQVLEVVDTFGVKMVLTLGALLAEVPHNRPVGVMGTASDDLLADRFELQRSRYEGPTGIVGVLQDFCRQRDIPAASLWATVPHYAPGASSPKAALALVERLSLMLDLPIATTALQIASAAYERQVNELIEGDDDLVAYVERLESMYDDGTLGDDDDDDDDEIDGDDEIDNPSGELLVEEVERFLRDQGPS